MIFEEKIMKLAMKSAAILSGVLLSASAFGQSAAAESDPFDFSSSASQVDRLGIVTKPEVDELRRVVTEHFNAGNCDAALPLLEELSRKSNWLANMVSSTLSPFYSASREDRRSYVKIVPLIPLENMSNEYKNVRNVAFAMQGECLTKIGRQEQAIPVLLKALDLLTLDDEEWWERTRNNLLEIIEVEQTE